MYMGKIIHLATYIFIMLTFVGCFDLAGSCSNDIRNQIASDDGRNVITIFERNCGATTGFVQMVNIQANNQEFDPNRGVVFVLEGVNDLEVNWIDSSSLHIKCSNCSSNKIFLKETNFNGIEIIY